MAQTLSDLTQTEPLPGHGRWEAELCLGFAAGAGKTVLKHRSHKGPLSVQRALYPEGAICHSYLLHPPGGVVGGDSLTVKARTEAGAEALVTTPGATRFYRSDGLVASLSQQLDVAADSRLEWMPLENIAFPNAHLETKTMVNLSTGSQFIGWDIWMLGQPVAGQSFGEGSVDGMTQISIDNQLILSERFRVNPRLSAYRAATLREFPVSGTLYVYGDAQALALRLEAWREALASHRDLVIGLTVIDGLLVVRGLSKRTDALFSAFTHCWLHAREHWTGETPEIPRIWRT